MPTLTDALEVLKIALHAVLDAHVLQQQGAPENKSKAKGQPCSMTAALETKSEHTLEPPLCNAAGQPHPNIAKPTRPS